MQSYSRLKEIFTKDSLQMTSFTITEKGYSLVNGKGELIPDVAADFVAGPEKPKSYIGKVASLLYTRYPERTEAHRYGKYGQLFPQW